MNDNTDYRFIRSEASSAPGNDKAAKLFYEASL